MSKVVVTGIGIVSSLGNCKEAVLTSLREGRSGLVRVPHMRDLGYQCQVAGMVRGFEFSPSWHPDGPRLSLAARYAVSAARQAFDDARFRAGQLDLDRVGTVVGTGVGGANDVNRAETSSTPMQEGFSGLEVMRLMNSTAALAVARCFGFQGRCYSVSSACSTGAENIGHAYELVRDGLLDVCFCGSAEEHGYRTFWAFGEALRASQSDFNDRPEAACRPYDRDRQGLIVSEGAGVLVLESTEHAELRGAPVYAEVVGYASANDGSDIFEPNGVGLRPCIRDALRQARLNTVDYVNTHGPGTLIGDRIEVEALRDVFRETSPLISSTKGLSGHASAAAGAHEMIYTLLMMQHGFIAATANLDNVAPECEGLNHVRQTLETRINTALSFNAGLGGANAALVLRRVGSQAS